MLLVLFWSSDTYRFLRHSMCDEPLDKEPNAHPESLPTFHILIAAYRAAHSIGPVLRAIANQDYPKDRYCTWVITEHSELKASNRQAERLVEQICNLEAEDIIDDQLGQVLWRCLMKDVLAIDDWIKELTSGAPRAYLSHNHLWPIVLADFLHRLFLLPDRDCFYKSAAFTRMQLSAREATHLKHVLLQIDAKTSKVAADFGRILGNDKLYTNSDLASHLIQEQLHKGRMQSLGTCLCRRFADSSATMPQISRQVAEWAVRLTLPSTQAVVQQLRADYPHSEIKLLDPYNRGFKPGALNIAYRAIRDQGLLDISSSSFFLIIDADSLLHSAALRTTALEATYQAPPGIMQMTSIPTANFFSTHWFSQFVSFADAIGAVGKWARSTRKQLKPDLHAGSGVLVPVALAEFIERETGFAWDEKTLTEDARLIVGQFGMMNGVRNKTRALPTYLLEAVPEGDRFISTYNSFWNQRRRWTVGGYDEIFYMMRCPFRLRNSCFDSYLRRWEVCKQSKQAVVSCLRQLNRLVEWCWDHFMWGLGGFMIMTHWWLISLLLAAPSRPVSIVGLTALLLTPAAFLAIAGKQLSWFIAGGLSFNKACQLYICAFFAIWLYCFPTVLTQLRCFLGLRGKDLKWRPTQKPRYQVEINIEE